MTAVYTHTRPETKQRQLEEAFSVLAASQYAEQWLSHKVAASLSSRTEWAGMA